eukprot:TRINITY_DN9713_c0_g1_i2.p2 TRINITY_DN9713_c0_g1~~TRINITY_DN9713_c0_g1_i2.p2  ORF type:complete len:218 (-),score=43.99 TRINITY_DN9713_c0_g1_i2:85-738(-)
MDYNFYGRRDEDFGRDAGDGPHHRHNGDSKHPQDHLHRTASPSLRKTRRSSSKPTATLPSCTPWPNSPSTSRAHRRRYKYMDNNLARKKLSMKMKLPDIKKALEMVTFMKERGQVEKPEAVNVKFALTENMWANASIKNDTGKVCLWLGADTMVEYPYDEAIELLKKNMSNAEKYLESVEGDISFLKDQMTTTEVNMARIYNENIAIKQSANVSAKI